MNINILLLFIYAVSNVQCLYNNRQEYTRIKRAKYNYPSKFFKLPPSSSQITGPFSYTPPPGYMGDNGPPPGYAGDNGPPPANLKAYKVSKKPSNGLGDEDIHNLFKYLSKQDLNKIVELAVEKDKLSEHRTPYLDKNNFEYGSSTFENQEQRPFYKDFDEEQDTRVPFNLKDENIEYLNPNFNYYQDRLQRITRNQNGSPNDNFDYPEGIIKNYNTPSENFDFPPANSKNYNNLQNNFEYMQEMTRNYKSTQNNNYDYLHGKISDYDNLEKDNFIYSPETTKNLNSVLNKNLDYPERVTESYNIPQVIDFNYQQSAIKKYIGLIQNDNANNPQYDNINDPSRIIKNYNNLQNENVKYPQGISSSNDRLKNNNYINPQETLYKNNPQNYNNANVNPPGVGDLTSQDQLLFLDNYIQKEMSKQRPENNMFSNSAKSQDQSSPQPLYPQEQDYQISYTNNVPQVINAGSNAYKVENFADLPLMNYDSKLDTVNSYNVPHYTVTQVNNRQQAAVQTQQSLPEPAKPAIGLAPPRSAGRDQSDAHLKAIKIWTHRSKGMAYTLHKDGTLSPERPIRPKFKPSR